MQLQFTAAMRRSSTHSVQRTVAQMTFLLRSKVSTNQTVAASLHILKYNPLPSAQHKNACPTTFTMNTREV
jgi:hypothetical protein